MADESRSTWRRSFNRYVGLVTAAVGVTIVLSSFLFLRDFFWWYITVGLGLAVALLGFIYGVNPFFTSERRYHALRRELEEFTGLVRQLNAATTTEKPSADLDRVKAAMHESVDRMAGLAGKAD
jgi:hypothetical protein